MENSVAAYTNPFEILNRKLDRLETTLQIICGNLPKPKEEKQPDPEELLSLKEVAVILKIPVNTARYYITTRNLPAAKAGKEFKIKRCELQDWIDTEYLKKGPKTQEESVDGNRNIASGAMRSKFLAKSNQK
ncbi:MAG TPA: helix-turn-helix domain-containing protein [Arachidicoccus sp.]|nr:helix-turn-helix domain-containing protein [Arachidicoccus sp.]